MKIGDRVRVIASITRLSEIRCPSDIKGKVGRIEDIVPCARLPYSVRLDDDDGDIRWRFGKQDIEPVELVAKPSESEPIRTFDTGATRDTATGKLSYVKALSPIVLRRYIQYLDKHRLQPDGSTRAFDNWKKGIPVETYLDSLMRHAVDYWLLMDGFSAEDNHGPVNKEDLLCAIIFNASGALHEMIKETESCEPI